MTTQAPIVIHGREAFFIRKKDLNPDTIDLIQQAYTFRFYEEKSCDKCEWKPDRHSDICDNCAAFKGGAVLAKDVKVGKNAYLSTPIGDAKGLKKLLAKQGFEDVTLKRHFPNKEFSRKIRFTGTLKGTQPEAVEAMVTKKRGVCKAPPRSGKTVMSSAAICRIGKKTIIMASQRDWLVGFYETFVGSKTQTPLTNASKEKIGFARTYEEFIKYDICLVTTQTFWSEKGEKLLQRIKNMFAVIVIDEVHTSAANKYASVIAKLNCEWKIGLSGTPSRKDGRFTIAKALIGPNLYDMQVERSRPTIRLVRTQYTRVYKGQVPWTSMVSSLEKDPKRLKLIAEWALKDAKDGHMVLIPLSQVTPIKALVLAINKIAGKKVAYPFYGQVKKPDRDLTIERAREFKIRIIVGNTKLLSTGINIPRASALYDVAMSSNLENCEQRVSRILTPWEDKPPPILRIFLDNMNVRKNCLRNEYFQCVRPRFKPIISAKDEEVLKGYFKEKARALNETMF